MALKIAAVTMLAVAVVAMLAASAAAQGTSLSCASNLAPCQPYLNSTKPPAECCGPLKEAVTKDLPCLCAIFRNPDILKSFNIDVNQALKLPANCGITGSSAICSDIAGASPSGSAVPPGAPPSTPGNNNGANGTGRAGLLGLAGLFFIWWSIFA